MDVLDFIKHNHSDKTILCEQLFFVHGTYSFQKRLDKAHTIISSVSKKFHIPLSHIKVSGSAHLGVSLQKGTAFNEKQSDLDLAIIDADLYAEILNQIYKRTNYYKNQSLFSIEEIEYQGKTISMSYFDMYTKWLTKGVVHPKYFPNIDYKRDWESFFSELSRKNRGIFKNISACVYLSETSFKNKQVSSINTALKSLSNSPLEMASP